MASCECDYDVRWTEYPDFRHVRTNHSTLCPIHDKCEWCDERIAVVIDGGDKLCQECLEELTEEQRKREEAIQKLMNLRHSGLRTRA